MAITFAVFFETQLTQDVLGRRHTTDADLGIARREQDTGAAGHGLIRGTGRKARSWRAAHDTKART
jgi:hypothetical protein